MAVTGIPCSDGFQQGNQFLRCRVILRAIRKRSYPSRCERVVIERFDHERELPDFIFILADAGFHNPPPGS
jgi:hypothetical protein